MYQIQEDIQKVHLSIWSCEKEPMLTAMHYIEMTAGI